MDDISLFDGEDKAWGEMLRVGFNVILTHWPNFVNEYRKTYQKESI